MPEPSEDAIELDDEGKPLAGVKAKQAAVEYLKSVLEQVLPPFLWSHSIKRFFSLK